jgi:RNase P subunit RPR2
MIDLSTLACLHEHENTLAAYCPRCDRWLVLPLAELVAAGHGSRRLPVPVRCQDCGSP